MTILSFSSVVGEGGGGLLPRCLAEHRAYHQKRMRWSLACCLEAGSVVEESRDSLVELANIVVEEQCVEESEHSRSTAGMEACPLDLVVRRLVGNQMVAHDLVLERTCWQDRPSRRLEIDRLSLDQVHMRLAVVVCVAVQNIPLAQLGLACLECPAPGEQ